MSESEILKQIQIVLASVGAKLFRNNVGTLKDRNGTYVTYGLCKGSADLIGWKTVKITQEMVGTEIAQFVAIEVKRPGGYPTVAQLNFLNAVHRAGGIANVCHSTSEALDTIT